MPDVLVALGQIAQPDILAVLVAGVLLGMAFGAMPGLDATSGTALFISATFAMSTEMALALLLGLYMSATYAGSITAISIGVPGTPAAAASVLDGYAMNRAGKMARALSISIAAATYGAILGTIALVVFTVPIGEVAVRFGAPEYFALGVLGLAMVAGLVEGAMLGGFIMALFGLLLTTVGIDHFTAFPRFTFGNYNLAEGITYIPALVGLFAVSEAIMLMAERDRRLAPGVQTTRLINFDLPWSSVRGIAKASTIAGGVGMFLGALPAIGAATANWMGYNEARRFSRRPEQFGKGSEEGLAACESGAAATVSSSFIPLLTFGIPGSATDAVILGAMLLHGVVPGPSLFTENLPLVYFIFMTLSVSIVFMFLFGVVGVGAWIRLVQIPKPYIIATIITLSLIGSFTVRSNMTDVFLALGFGVFGFLIRRAGLSVVPVVLALVLGGLIEEHFRRSLVMSDAWIGIYLERPVALAILLFALVTFLYPVWRTLRRGVPRPA
ncbi:MAG: tripartite tricarboxylate transporter permease [Alphaproteobacteria bacterium]